MFFLSGVSCALDGAAATCAQGTKEDEENGGMPQRFYGVATNTEEDLTVIRPSADGDGAVGTVEWHHFDLDPDNSPVIKVCADDN